MKRFQLRLRTIRAAAIWTLAAPGLLFPVEFNAPRAYALDYNGEGVVVGDFNGDGKADLAAAVSKPYGSGRVEILLNQGDGTFRHGANYDLPSALSYGSNIVAGDFNNDGKLDLAIVVSVNIAVLLGNGDGTFQPAVTYAAGTSPYSIVSGDFNGDGNLDLATANSSSNNVSILLGKGDGTFLPAANYAVGTQPEYLAVGDLNGDGRSDLAVTNQNSKGEGIVSILYGVGDGTFYPAANHLAGTTPQSVAVGDFNRDGRPDLAIASSDGTLSIMLAAAGGVFQPPVTVDGGPSPGAVTVVDLNHDGKLDLAVVNLFTSDSGPGGQTISILTGNGDGTFQAPVAYNVFYLPISLAFGDFNGDGRLDLAVASGGYGNEGGQVSILLNNGSGGFEQPPAFAAGNDPENIVAGDFNGDGKLDLAVLSTSGVLMLLGNGDGTFQPAFTAAATIGGYLAAADFNRDGNLDLAVATTSGVVILLGNGDGTFQTGSIVPLADPYLLAVADFNGIPGLVTILNEVFVVALVGNGDGTFRTVTTVSEGFLSNLGVGDFNGDGKADLAVQEQIPGEYTIYETAILLGDGEGSFGGYQATYVGLYNNVAVGDFNGDGKLDVASGQGAEYVALGNGNGTFGAPARYLAGGDAGYSAIADFNRDGKLDLIAGEAGCVSILLGNGDGTFQPGKEFLTATGWFAIGDFNGDGKPDLAVTDGISKVYILTNTTK